MGDIKRGRDICARSRRALGVRRRDLHFFAKEYALTRWLEASSTEGVDVYEVLQCSPSVMEKMLRGDGLMNV